ncbi:outer membrane protein TolC [Dysgonomonadaceae bacterium PH5-43]|nr:outer membrane protein TolC [Dysgonomonadaceae bacterium PH5-43]
MRKIKYIYCVLIAFTLFPIVEAQEIYNLHKVLETGLDRNFDIRIVRNEQQIADNNTTLANAGMLPSLDLSVGYNGSIMNTDQTMVDGSKNSRDNIFNQGANVGLNFSWTVFDGFQMQTQYSKLKEYQQMGEISTRLSIDNLISNLTAEYYNYIRQKLRLKNLSYAVSLSKERLRIEEERYNIGSTSRLDLQQARVDFNADSSNLIKQYEVLNTSSIVLNQLMVLDDVSQNIIIKDTVIKSNMFMTEEELWKNTLAANGQLLLAAKNKTLSELDKKTYQSKNYPYLRLNGGYGYTINLYDNTSPSSLDKQSNLGFNYGVTLGFSIFDGNRKREQKNARINIENRELEYERLELALKADLATILMAYKNNIELLSLEEENVETARQNYEIAMERYRLGDLAGIEIREAQNSLLAAEERLLDAKYNTKLCEISLLQISGQVTSYLE